MSGRKLGHLGLDRLRQETARAGAGELILESLWLNQLDNVIVHGAMGKTY